MDHVVGRGDDADLLVDRHHHGVVHLEQVVGGGVLDVAAVEHHTVAAVQCGDEGQAFAFAGDVVIAPLPLVARGLDCEVGVGSVLLGDQHLGGGQGHEDHDDERNNGPDHFDRHRLMEVGSLRALGAAMLPDRVEHHGEHCNKDHRADDQHHPMQKMLLFCDLGDGRRQVQLVDCRAARQVLNGMGCGAHPCTGNQQQRSQLVGNALHSSHLLLSLNLTNPFRAPAWGQAARKAMRISDAKAGRSSGRT